MLGGKRSKQMNLHRPLAALFVILALVGCAQAATGEGQAPDAPDSHDSGPDMRQQWHVAIRARRSVAAAAFRAGKFAGTRTPAKRVTDLADETKPPRSPTADDFRTTQQPRRRSGRESSLIQIPVALQDAIAPHRLSADRHP